MTNDKKRGLTVISNPSIEINETTNYQKQDYATNPMYQKLLNFRTLQENQKKRFSVEDLFKLC